MAEIGIRALKQNASAVVARAAAGESLTVTDRGRPVARITPLEASVVGRLIAAGEATPPRRSIIDMPAPTITAHLSEAVSAARQHERY